MKLSVGRLCSGPPRCWRGLRVFAKAVGTPMVQGYAWWYDVYYVGGSEDDGPQAGRSRKTETSARTEETASYPVKHPTSRAASNLEAHASVAEKDSPASRHGQVALVEFDGGISE